MGNRSGEVVRGVRRLVACLILLSAGLVGGCAISPTSYLKEGPGHSYQCFLELGPLSGHPTAPDATFPVLGDVLYEACWILE